MDANNPKEGLPQRIQERLDDLNLSMRAASLAAGLGETAVRDILKGRNQSPSLESIIDLAVALQCSLDWLVNGVGSKEVDLDAWVKKKMLNAWGHMSFHNRSNMVTMLRAVAIMDYLFGDNWGSYMVDDPMWDAVKKKIASSEIE